MSPGPTLHRPWSRRRLLRTTLDAGTLALAALLAPPLLRPGAALAAVCAPTPAQGEGPFYPPRFGRPGNDLLAVGGDGATALGEPIAIAGHVTDARCRPVPGAMVEIWQADAHGRYHHPHDAGPEPRDPHFRYWGRAVADADGAYRFRTILPAPYRMGWSWRTPHVHFKVRGAAGVLTTQMYFAGHELNARDGLLRALPEPERARVIALPAPDAAPLRVWRFDIAVA